MNILPKKSWHVRNKDNIARVRRDEAEARDKERIRQEKLDLAESEARINFLRRQSGIPERQTNDDPAPSTGQQHTDLFADYKSHVKTTNKELEKEKKEEREKYEKQIGYLTYLGQDTNEALRLRSWYELPPKRKCVEGKTSLETDLKNKYNQDPLTLISAILPPDKKSTSKLCEKKPQKLIEKEIDTKDSDSIVVENNKKKHKKKHKKEKDHKRTKKRHKHKRDPVAEIKKMQQKRDKLDKLRKERFLREARESVRQNELLNPKEQEVSQKKSATDIIPPRVTQKYNNQFNPNIAKQNMI